MELKIGAYVEKSLKPLFRNERETNQSDNIAETHSGSKKSVAGDNANDNGREKKGADKSK